MQKRIAEVILYPLDRDMNKIWFVSYPNPSGGRPLKKYGNLNNIKSLDDRILEADQMILDLKRKVRPIDLDASRLHRSLSQVVDMRSLGKRKKTVIAYQNKAKIFLQWFNQLKSKELTTQSGAQFLQWVANRETVQSNTTINCYRRDMRSFFKDIVDQGAISFNPFEQTRKLKETQRTNTWFREAEQRALKKAITDNDSQLWLACMIQFYCFVRPGEEMASLKIGSIDKSAENWRFKIEGDAAKTNYFRFIKIPNPLKKLLIPYIGNYPDYYYLIGKNRMPSIDQIGKNTLYNRHRIYLKGLGLEDGHTFYSWKNTGAVMMYKNGMKLKYISMLMGHSGVEITDAYFKSLGIDDVFDEIELHYPEI